MMHAQALKDWGTLRASTLSPVAQAAFLLASIIPFSTEDVDTRETYVLLSEMEPYLPKSPPLREVLAFVEQQGFGSLRGLRFYLGHAEGLYTRVYAGLEQAQQAPATPAATPPAKKNGPPPALRKSAGPSTTAPPPAGPKVALDLTALKKEVLSPIFSAYQNAMETLRKQDVLGKVADYIQTAIQAAETGTPWTGKMVMEYLSALAAMHFQQEVVMQRYSAKELKMAGDLLLDLGAGVLVELLPYFIMHYCDPQDEWKGPGVQTVVREKTKLLARYTQQKKTHARTSGKFS